MEIFSKLMVINPSTQAIEHDSGRSGRDAKALKSIYGTLTSVVESDKKVYSAIIESMNGDKHCTSQLTRFTDASFAVCPKAKILEARGPAVWQDTFTSEFLSNVHELYRSGMIS